MLSGSDNETARRDIASGDGTRSMGASDVLKRWNGLDRRHAAAEILPCCGSTAWADVLAAQRPFADGRTLIEASLRIWFTLSEADWNEAFESHPRIGERKGQGAASATALAWSEEEQSAAMSAEEAERRDLHEANARYEQRFGRIFLVCARGRSVREILTELERRFLNTPEVERLEAAEQQAEITALRLGRWLAGL